MFDMTFNITVVDGMTPYILAIYCWRCRWPCCLDILDSPRTVICLREFMLPGLLWKCGQ